jgi:hypothetical protein
MTDMRRFGLADALLLLAILAGAAGARVAYLSLYCQNGAGDGPYQVQDDWSEERVALVANLRQGHVFQSRAPLAARDETTAHVAIGYPWLLSLLDGGWLNLPDDQLVRWLQCGLGTLTAGLYFLFARRAFQSLLIATLAGLLCAIHPYWVINTAELNDGTVVTFLVGLCLFLGARGSQGGGALTSLLFGLGLAALACVRAALLPFGFAALLAFLMRCRTLPRGWLYSVLVVLGFFNGLIPWTVRNYQSFGTIVPIVDSLYLHFWMGNNSRATGGPETEETMRQAIADASATDNGLTIEQLEKMRQPERYHRLAEQSLTEIQNHPAAALERRLRAGLGFFFGMSWLEGHSLVHDNPAASQEDSENLSRWMPTLLAGSLLGMLLLSALGWRWAYAWRRLSVPASMAVIWIPLPYLLSHAEMFHGARLPLDGVLLSLAAFALACLVPGLNHTLFEGEGT